METRAALDTRAIALMGLLCAVWGLQQIAIKAAAPDMAPLLQIGVRSGAAAVLVALFLRGKGLGLFPPRQALRPGALAGLLFSLEYVLVGEGLRFTNASHMVAMLYTAPAFAALGLHLRLPEERLRPGQWAGLGLAFCGIATAFYGRPSDATMLWGDVLGLLAGMAWGATTVVIRCSALSRVSAAQTVFCQLLAAFAIVSAVSAATGQLAWNASPLLWSSLLYQTIIVSFASFLAWFWLLKTYLASRLGVLSFLTPVFGMLFGVALLGETVEPQFVAGTVLVVAGVALVSGWQWLSPAPDRKKNQPSGRRGQADAE